MCSTLRLDWRYDHSNFESFLECAFSEGNVFCETLRATEDFSISGQKWPSLSTKHVHVSDAPSSLWWTNILVFLKCNPEIYIFEGTQKSIQDVVGDVFCSGRFCSRLSCVFFQTWKKMLEFATNVCNAKRAPTLRLFF